MNIRQALEQQLDRVEPCSGDFLGGLSHGEKVEQTITSWSSSMTREQAEQYVNNRIVEWAEHKGERAVFVIIEHPAPESKQQHNQITFSVAKVWETELDQFENTHRFVRMSSKDGFPIVEPKYQ